MATETAEKIEQLRFQALGLPEAERADLAYELIKSLDAPEDEGVESAWNQEVLRRIALVDDGQARLIDREAFRKRMQARIHNL